MAPLTWVAARLPATASSSLTKALSSLMTAVNAVDRKITAYGKERSRPCGLQSFSGGTNDAAYSLGG